MYIRFKIYFKISYLKTETNKSLINKALLKYAYSKHRLEIIEYCDPPFVNFFFLASQKKKKEKEQYYLDKFNYKYNILKIAIYLMGFKHSRNIIERIKAFKLGCSVNIKLYLSSNLQAHSIIATNIEKK